MNRVTRSRNKASFGGSIAVKGVDLVCFARFMDLFELLSECFELYLREVDVRQPYVELDMGL